MTGPLGRPTSRTSDMRLEALDAQMRQNAPSASRTPRSGACTPDAAMASSANDWAMPHPFAHRTVVTHSSCIRSRSSTPASASPSAVLPWTASRANRIRGENGFTAC